jgi:hypothetical protein
VNGPDAKLEAYFQPAMQSEKLKGAYRHEE